MKEERTGEKNQEGPQEEMRTETKEVAAPCSALNSCN